MKAYVIDRHVWSWFARHLDQHGPWSHVDMSYRSVAHYCLRRSYQ